MRKFVESKLQYRLLLKLVKKVELIINFRARKRKFLASRERAIHTHTLTGRSEHCNWVCLGPLGLREHLKAGGRTLQCTHTSSFILFHQASSSFLIKALHDISYLQLLIWFSQWACILLGFRRAYSSIITLDEPSCHQRAFIPFTHWIVSRTER
jgi:hypothetical protein